MLLETIAEKYIWFLLVILAGNLMQRKHQARSQKKRLATLIIAALAMLLQIFITLILTWKWPQWVVFPALIIVVALAFLLRNRLFIFKTTCASCSKKLSFTQAFNFDDNLCDECHAEAHPEEVKIKEVPKAEEKIVALCKAETVDEIDWDFWEPTETAVLCYLFEDDKVLLINKKRGLGEGLVNAPGGHVEDAETAKEAAIREVREETGLIVENPIHMGVLEFQFRDGLRMRGHVFFAQSYSGTLIDTDEAEPFWCPVAEIPYDKMWQDDALWLPEALSGKHFYGQFIFDDRTMLSHRIEYEQA